MIIWIMDDKLFGERKRHAYPDHAAVGGYGKIFWAIDGEEVLYRVDETIVL